MKTKDFFKSNSFKCILVLLIITLVCGAVIAACAVLFRVSDEERLNRSLAKIYGSVEDIPKYSEITVRKSDGGELEGDAKSRSITLFHDSQGFYPDDPAELAKPEQERMSSYTAVIQQVIMDETGKCLVKSRGKGCGFTGGSVTVWVMFAIGDGVEKIEKAVYVNNETDSSQTLIGQFGDAFFAEYTTDEATAVVTGGGYFVTGKMSVGGDNIEVISSGATYTSTAMDVAVNGALYYVREQLPNGSLTFIEEDGNE